MRRGSERVLCAHIQKHFKHTRKHCICRGIHGRRLRADMTERIVHFWEGKAFFSLRPSLVHGGYHWWKHALDIGFYHPNSTIPYFKWSALDFLPLKYLLCCSSFPWVVLFLKLPVHTHRANVFISHAKAIFQYVSKHTLVLSMCIISLHSEIHLPTQVLIESMVHVTERRCRLL